jgi:hypothetical protein
MTGNFAQLLHTFFHEWLATPVFKLVELIFAP